MALISEEEKQRREQIVVSVLGTNAMEGIALDNATMAAIGRFESGALSLEEFSSMVRGEVYARFAARGSHEAEAVETAASEA